MKTRTQLALEINTLLADNSNNEVTLNDIRTVLGYLVESLYNITDDTDVNDAVSKKHSHTSSLVNIEDAVSKKHSHSAAAAFLNAAFTSLHLANGTGETPGDYNLRAVTTLGIAQTNDAKLALAIIGLETAVDLLTTKLNSALATLRTNGLLTP